MDPNKPQDQNQGGGVPSSDSNTGGQPVAPALGPQDPGAVGGQVPSDQPAPEMGNMPQPPMSEEPIEEPLAGGTPEPMPSSGSIEDMPPSDVPSMPSSGPTQGEEPDEGGAGGTSAPLGQ